MKRLGKPRTKLQKTINIESDLTEVFYRLREEFIACCEDIDSRGRVTQAANGYLQMNPSCTYLLGITAKMVSVKKHLEPQEDTQAVPEKWRNVI